MAATGSLSDSASEMGNIVEFASTGGRLGGGRVPERLPCGGGAGGVTRKAGLLAACLLAPVGDIDFFLQCVASLSGN